MTCDSEHHHRRSMRLRGYDYARAGAYFVTICLQGRRSLFGAIESDAMNLNETGRMVERWWMELQHKHPSVEIDEYVVMPNHLHGIILISNPVGAALRGRPPA